MRLVELFESTSAEELDRAVTDLILIMKVHNVTSVETDRFVKRLNDMGVNATKDAVIASLVGNDQVSSAEDTIELKTLDTVEEPVDAERTSSLAKQSAMKSIKRNS